MTTDNEMRSIDSIAVDFIAATVKAQSYQPMKHHYRRGSSQRADVLASFIDRYGRNEDDPLTLEYLASRFPHYGINTEAVAPMSLVLSELQDAYNRSDAIDAINTASLAVRNNDLEAVERVFNEHITRPRTGDALGSELLDPALYELEECDIVPLPNLGPAAGDGLRRAEYMLVAARTGVGKSWTLLMALTDIMEAGWDVMLLSLEMPRAEVAKRMAMLRRCTAVEQRKWLASLPGKLRVVDQTDVPRGITAHQAASRIERSSNTAVIIDYGELLRPESGGRSSEGHQKSGEISESLQNITKQLNIPVIAAVQENREALQRSGSGTETISGSDRWGRDADTVLKLTDTVGQLREGMKPGQGPTRVLEAIKTRHSAARDKAYYRYDITGDGIRLISHHDYVLTNEKFLLT